VVVEQRRRTRARERREELAEAIAFCSLLSFLLFLIDFEAESG